MRKWQKTFRCRRLPRRRHWSMWTCNPKYLRISNTQTVVPYQEISRSSLKSLNCLEFPTNTTLLCTPASRSSCKTWLSNGNWSKTKTNTKSTSTPLKPPRVVETLDTITISKITITTIPIMTRQWSRSNWMLRRSSWTSLIVTGSRIGPAFLRKVNTLATLASPSNSGLTAAVQEIWTCKSPGSSAKKVGTSRLDFHSQTLIVKTWSARNLNTSSSTASLWLWLTPKNMLAIKINIIAIWLLNSTPTILKTQKTEMNLALTSKKITSTTSCAATRKGVSPIKPPKTSFKLRPT